MPYHDVTTAILMCYDPAAVSASCVSYKTSSLRKSPRATCEPASVHNTDCSSNKYNNYSISGKK